LPGLGVLPVEVRLLRAEEMKVVFLCVFIPFPDAACEVGYPVVWGLAFTVDVAGWAPVIPIALWVVFGGAGFQKPLVLHPVSLRRMWMEHDEDAPDQRYDLLPDLV
jgi:hypothetical protein